MSKTMNVAEVTEFIKSVKGATPVTISYSAPVKMKKTGNPFADCELVKNSMVNGMIGIDYEKSVNRQLIRDGEEPDFKAGPRTWGEHEGAAIVVNAQGIPSLCMKVQAASAGVYQLGECIVDKATIEAFLPAKKESDEAGSIVYRNFRIDRIKKISIKNEVIEIIS